MVTYGEHNIYPIGDLRYIYTYWGLYLIGLDMSIYSISTNKVGLSLQPLGFLVDASLLDQACKPTNAT